MKRAKVSLAVAPFFVLRTPLLPLAEFAAWAPFLSAPAAKNERELEQALAADATFLRKRLRQVLAQPVVREAIFVASPDLEEALPLWERDPTSERGQRVERALVRYLARMAGRPTPFGLFAGCSTGVVGAETLLHLAAQSAYWRCSSVDMGYLEALLDRLRVDTALRAEIVYRPNPTLYRAADQRRYVEWRAAGDGGLERTYHLVAVEETAELAEVLTAAAGGARIKSLAPRLAGVEATLAEASAYVMSLIDAKILLPDLGLSLTGDPPARALVDQLAGLPAGREAAARLAGVLTELAAIDATGVGASPSAYRDIAAHLRALPAAVELAELFHVDLFKPAGPAGGISLGSAVVRELERGVGLLLRLAPRPAETPLDRFRAAFERRYETREVPLLEALDEDLGVGFGGQSEGLEEKGSDSASGPQNDARDRMLLRKLAETWKEGGQEMALGRAELELLPTDALPELPAAVAVMASLARRAGDTDSGFQVLIHGVVGPSGATLLGRFCHGDPALRAAVETHLAVEEATDPEAIFAEIVHLPEGRLGNILRRPVLRRHEVPLFTRSRLPSERQIPVSDLSVSAEAGRVILRSFRLGRRIVPRLTSAHNFSGRTPSLYRFLCALQSEGTVPRLRWDWGPYANAPFLPRVTCGRIVFCRARWRLGGKDLEALAGSSWSERFQAVQALRARLQLPRWVLLAEGDNELPIDLDNVLSTETLVPLVKGRDEVDLYEMFPGPCELLASGPEGRFTHECIVPFVRTDLGRAVTSPAVGRPVTRRDAPAKAPDARRSFPPGSDWLYAKLYAGPSSVDRLLAGPVRQLAEQTMKRGSATGWFFLRYGDPEWHLRLRFFGKAKLLRREVQPRLERAFAKLLDRGWVWRIQFDTYEREAERYGGPHAIVAAEQFFQADSEAVVELLRDLEPGDAGNEERRRLALLGLDALYRDFGVDLVARRAMATRLAAGEAGEVDADVRRRWREALRRDRPSLLALLDSHGACDPSLAPGVEVLARRSRRLEPIVRELAALERSARLNQPVVDMLPSFLHMFLNRLLRAISRRQELEIHDVLAHLYAAQGALGPPQRRSTVG